ncbi:MAG: hypothetical protein AXA67_12970 [Methylothermaceae bacteria B42]|nr:MAG: hypothetical protein AXA67_12970 [Methylothermaceae bacteria B42]HHJ38464.1 outer membrane protein assembly factor BamB [Methylothermaceae bacterium]
MRLLTLLVISIALAGCQSLGASFSNAISGTVDLVTGGGEVADPPRELKSIDPEIEIEVLWDEDIGAGDDGHWLALTLANAGDKLFAADQDGLITAIRFEDGETIWEVETEQPISSGPSLGLESVIVGTSEAEVIAVRQEDGETLWTAKVSSEVLAPPEVSQGIVVVHSNDGALFALDEANGKVLWSYEQRASPLSLRGSGAPTIESDVVVVGFAKGKLAVLRLSDGKILWERQVALTRGVSEVDRLVDIDSKPVIDDNIIFVTAYHGGVVAVSLVDGEVIWRNDRIVASSNPAISWRYVFITDENSDVWSLDKNTGRPYWKQTDLHRRKLTSPVIYKDYLVVGDYKGYLHFLSREDGHQMGRIRISRSPIRTAPVVHEDYLISYASDGDLAVLTVTNE